VGPREMRMASMHSITALITCGDCVTVGGRGGGVVKGMGSRVTSR